MDTKAIAMIGSVVTVWLSIAGLIVLAALFDHDIAATVVNAFIAIVVTSVGGTTAVHIFGHSTTDTAATTSGGSASDPKTLAGAAS